MKLHISLFWQSFFIIKEMFNDWILTSLIFSLWFLFKKSFCFCNNCYHLLNCCCSVPGTVISIFQYIDLNLPATLRSRYCQSHFHMKLRHSHKVTQPINGWSRIPAQVCQNPESIIILYCILVHVLRISCLNRILWILFDS